jgi:hypothetical protein
MSLDQDGSRGARDMSDGVAVANAHAYTSTTFNTPVPTDGRRSWPSTRVAGFTSSEGSLSGGNRWH